MKEPSPSTYSSGAIRRIRNGAACIRCRKNKRRCDGQRPCSACKRNDYECNYNSTLNRPENRSRKKEFAGTQDLVETPVKTQTHGSSNQEHPILAFTRIGIELPSHGRCDQGGEPLKEELADAISSSKSFQRLLERLETANIPRIQPPSFNLGLAGAQYQLTDSSLAISSSISFEQLQLFSGVYFEKINPVYGLVRREQFDFFVSYIYGQHGDDSAIASKEIDNYNPVICGVVALGCLFSRKNYEVSDEIRDMIERKVLAITQEQLDSPQATDLIEADSSGVFCVISWMLRTIYLRCTSSPLSTWVACCRSANIASFVKLNDERKWSSLKQDTNHLRHLFWSLEIFNTWLSIEIAQPKASFLYVTCQYPIAVDEEDVNPGLVELYDKTKDAFVTGDIEPEQCYSALYSLLRFKSSHPVISMDHGYLAIILFRRIKVFNMSETTLSGLMKTALESLTSCEELARRGEPWWQTINVPFHLLTMVIMAEKPRFTLEIPNILESMVSVGREFCTKEVSNAICIARELINILRMLKEKEMLALSRGISKADEALSRDKPETASENLDPSLLLNELLMMNEFYA